MVEKTNPYLCKDTNAERKNSVFSILQADGFSPYHPHFAVIRSE